MQPPCARELASGAQNADPAKIPPTVRTAPNTGKRRTASDQHFHVHSRPLESAKRACGQLKSARSSDRRRSRPQVRALLRRAFTFGGAGPPTCVLFGQTRVANERRSSFTDSPPPSGGGDHDRDPSCSEWEPLPSSGAHKQPIGHVRSFFMDGGLGSGKSQKAQPKTA